MPTERKSPTVRHRRLADRMRETRERAGLSKEDVRAATRITGSALWRIENAETVPQPGTLNRLLALYGASDVDRALLADLRRTAHIPDDVLIQHADQRPTHPEYMRFEATASVVQSWQPVVVPGMLQTEAYARALINGWLPMSANDVDDRVRARLERQSLLTRDDPLRFDALLDESALLRPIGGRQIMAGQAGRLLEWTQRENVTIQVVPLDAGAHPGTGGSFMRMAFPDPHHRSIVYTENPAGDMYLEDPGDVARFQRVFEGVRAVALSVDDTRSLLADVAGRGVPITGSEQP